MPLPTQDIESTPLRIPTQSKIHFTKSRLTATYHATSNLTLLQFAEKQGLNPDYGCRSGMCGTCETRVVKGETEGEVGDRDGRVSLSEKDGEREREGEMEGERERERWILICCSVPVSEEVWLEK